MRESGAYEIRISKMTKKEINFGLAESLHFLQLVEYYPIIFAWTVRYQKNHYLCLEEIENFKKYSLQCANVFHAGDGNLHPLIMFDASDDAQLKSAEKFGADILKLCIAVGGTITGEHGWELRKLMKCVINFQNPN